MFFLFTLLIVVEQSSFNKNFEMRVKARISFKNPKLREQRSSGKKSSPTHKRLFNFKNWSGKSGVFEKLVGEK